MPFYSMGNNYNHKIVILFIVHAHSKEQWRWWWCKCSQERAIKWINRWFFSSSSFSHYFFFLLAFLSIRLSFSIISLERILPKDRFVHSFVRSLWYRWKTYIEIFHPSIHPCILKSLVCVSKYCSIVSGLCVALYSI